MRRLIILGLVALASLALPASAAEQITSFDVTIALNADSRIDVTEAMSYDFGSAERHGIYRDISVRYRTALGSYGLRLSNIRVVDTNNQPYPFHASRAGQNLRIRIGDPDATVTGRHTYLISYTVERALNYFADHDELYWNVTGDGWDVPIAAVQATVFVPQQVGSVNFQTTCFAGQSGSTDPCASADTLLGSYLGAPNTTALFSHGELAPGEGLTIVVGFPKGIVVEPAWWQTVLETVRDNWILGLPVVVLLALIFIWRRYGRDPQGRGTIIAQYDPPDGLIPSAVGTLIDERVSSRDVSADIIALAVQGFLKIHRVADQVVLDRFSKADNYILQPLKPADGLIDPVLQLLFTSLFKTRYVKTHAVAGRQLKGVRLSNLKNAFYKDFGKISRQVYRELATRGYFAVSPQLVRRAYLAFGIGLAILAVPFGRFLGGFGTLAVLVSGAMVISFSFIMPKKTKQGVLAREHIAGLKAYLTVAEKDRIKFHNAPEKNPETFERLLPYAMVLKVEDRWAKQFEGIYQQQPGWYADPSNHAFSAMVLTNSLSDFRAVSQHALQSSPQSAAGGGSGLGGGGFSGGGFGGGGGGSW